MTVMLLASQVGFYIAVLHIMNYEGLLTNTIFLNIYLQSNK